MPNMDKTGPQGQGPMTGRGLGICNGGSDKNVLKPCGRGRGVGRGVGRGMGRGYNQEAMGDKNKA